MILPASGNRLFPQVPPFNMIHSQHKDPHHHRRHKVIKTSWDMEMLCHLIVVLGCWIYVFFYKDRSIDLLKWKNLVFQCFIFCKLHQIFALTCDLFCQNNGLPPHIDWERPIKHKSVGTQPNTLKTLTRKWNEFTLVRATTLMVLCYEALVNHATTFIYQSGSPGFDRSMIPTRTRIAPG